jgi:hypothetical protein
MDIPWMLQVGSALHSYHFRLTLPLSDNVAARTLMVGIGTVGEVTIESCTAACYNAGYTLAGAEYSTQVSTCTIHANEWISHLPSASVTRLLRMEGGPFPKAIAICLVKAIPRSTAVVRML